METFPPKNFTDHDDECGSQTNFCGCCSSCSLLAFLCMCWQNGSKSTHTHTRTLHFAYSIWVRKSYKVHVIQAYIFVDEITKIKRNQRRNEKKTKLQTTWIWAICYTQKKRSHLFCNKHAKCSCWTSFGWNVIIIVNRNNLVFNECRFLLNLLRMVFLTRSRLARFIFEL